MSRVALGALLLLAATGIARANDLDSFGAGARAEGMAGALAGDASGWSAAHHNPAGAARGADAEAAVGYSYGVTRLTLDGIDPHVTTPRGTTLGLAIPFPLDQRGRFRAAFALAAYLPDQFIARIQLVPAAEPHFVLLDNNIQHIVVTPVLALRMPYLSIGAGITLLADAAGNGITFNVGLAGGQRLGTAAIDVSLPTRAAPVAGILVEPTPRLRFGATFRGEIDLKLKLDILAHVDVAGAVTGDVTISLRAINFYTPMRVALGAGWDILPSLTLSGEVAWLRWSGFTGGIPDTRILVDLGLSPPILQAMFPNQSFRDVWTPRLGAEWRRDLAGKATLSVRAGYAYERSPVPDQIGLTSFADNDRHVAALGVGIALPHVTSILPKPLRLDLAAQWHELVARTTIKDPRYFPGAGFSSGGRIIHLAATLEGRF